LAKHGVMTEEADLKFGIDKIMQKFAKAQGNEGG